MITYSNKLVTGSVPVGRIPDFPIVNLPVAVHDTVDLRYFLQRQIDDLRKTFETRLNERDERFTDRCDAERAACFRQFAESPLAAQNTVESQDRSVTKAEAATVKSVESVEGVRAQLSDQAARFLSRDEMTAVVETLTQKIDDLAAASRADLAMVIAKTNDNALHIEQMRSRSNGIGDSFRTLAASLSAVLTILAIAGILITSLRS